MLKSMSMRTLAGWHAYFELEPFGESRADMRAAQICAVLAEINRDRKARKKPFTALDFMPDFDDSRRTARRKVMDKEGFAELKRALMQRVPAPKPRSRRRTAEE